MPKEPTIDSRAWEAFEREARRSGYRAKDAVEPVRLHRREKAKALRTACDEESPEPS